MSKYTKKAMATTIHVPESKIIDWYSFTSESIPRPKNLPPEYLIKIQKASEKAEHIENHYKRLYGSK